MKDYRIKNKSTKHKLIHNLIFSDSPEKAFCFFHYVVSRRMEKPKTNFRQTKLGDETKNVSPETFKTHYEHQGKKFTPCYS